AVLFLFWPSHIQQACQHQFVRRHLLIFLDFVKDFLLPQFQHQQLMAQHFLPIGRRRFHQLPFFFCQRIKKDGAVSPIFFRVPVSFWCASPVSLGVLLALAVLVSWLPASLPWHGRFPFILAFPPSQQVIAYRHAFRHFFEVDFLPFGSPCAVFGFCLVPLFAPPRHSASLHRA